MADKLISDLANVAAHTSAAKIEVDQGGTPGHVTVLQLLSGRAGGTTFIGGTGSADKLVLQSTSHATRGRTSIKDAIAVLGKSDTTVGTLVSLNGTGAVADGAYVILDKNDGDDDAAIAYRVGGAIRWFEGFGGAAGGGTSDWALQKASGAAGSETIAALLTAVYSSGHLRTGSGTFFGIGTAPTEALHVTTTNARVLVQGTSQTKVTIKAGASQTENLFEVRNSTGVLKSYCDSEFIWHGITVEGGSIATDTVTAENGNFRHLTVDDPNDPVGTGDSWLRINVGELQATLPFAIYDADATTKIVTMGGEGGLDAGGQSIKLYDYSDGYDPTEYVAIGAQSVGPNGGLARTSMRITEYYNDVAVERFVVSSANATGTRVPAYNVTNVVTDRTYDANATSLDELADVVGTLIADIGGVGTLTIVVDGTTYTVLTV